MGSETQLGKSRVLWDLLFSSVDKFIVCKTFLSPLQWILSINRGSACKYLVGMYNFFGFSHMTFDNKAWR